MAGIKIYLSETHDPWFNLATEDWLFSEMDPESPVLFLWRNSDTVVIGRFQNPWTECDVEKMEEDQVALARRQSGGGAVFHDLGNTNFTFLSGIEDYSRERNNRIITDALAALGIEAAASGRNDILADGRKISGSAFKLKKDRAFHHGTLLVDADMTRLSRYLTPPPKKLEARGIASVRARVANLREFNRSVDHDTVCRAVMGSFREAYGKDAEPEILDHRRLAAIPKLAEYYNLMKDWEWRFGKTPEFTHRLEEKLSWAWMELYLNVREGIIREGRLYSDALIPELIQEINRLLPGTRYSREDLVQSFNGIEKRLPQYGSEIQELVRWLLKNI